MPIHLTLTLQELRLIEMAIHSQAIDDTTGEVKPKLTGTTLGNLAERLWQVRQASEQLFQK